MTRLNKIQIPISQIFLWILVFLNIIFALAYPTTITSILPTFFYLLMLVNLFERKPIAFLLFSPVILLHFSVLISLVAIDDGAFMKEVGRYGYSSAASGFYVIVVGFFLLAAGYVFPDVSSIEKYKPSINLKKNDFLLRWAAFTLTSIIIIVLVLKGLKTGFPLIAGYDRFAYRRVLGDPITISFLNLKIVVASFLGISANACKEKFDKFRHHIVFLLYLGVSFLFGDKFFIIITATLYYLAVQLAFKPDVVRMQAKRFFAPAVFSIFLAILMTFYIYSGKGVLSFDATLERLFERFSEQGQLWFVAFNDHPNWIGMDVVEVKNNLYCLIQNSGFNCSFDKKLGAFYFVQKFATSDMYYSFMGNKGYVAPIMSFEPYCLELFGYLGIIIVAIVTGILLGLIGKLLMAGISSGNPFRIVLPSFILTQFYYLIATGALYNLISIGRLKLYTVLLIIQFGFDWWFKKTR